MVQAINQGGQPEGISVTVGSPAATPFLRPLRNPIYDSEIYPAAGIGNLSFFRDVRNFVTAPGLVKQLVDTNLEQPRTLGRPNKFDLVGLNLELQRGAAIADREALNRNAFCEFTFGTNVSWLRIPARKIPEGVGQYGHVSLSGFAAATEQSVMSNGVPATNQIYNMTTPDKKARPILSQESFGATLNFGDTPPAISENLKYTLYLVGTLYNSL